MSLEPNKPLNQTMDDAEPGAESTPAPVLLIGLFALVLFLGFTYLERHGGGFDARVYPPYGSFTELDASQIKDPIQAARQIGQKNFNAVCAACHQSSGVGSPAIGAPPLAGSDWVQAPSPNRIIRIVMNGLSGPIDVSGGHYGTGVMVAFKDTFNDDQISAILTYVRSEWGNKAGPVTPEQVAAVRKQIADRGGNWTAPELQKIPDKD